MISKYSQFNSRPYEAHQLVFGKIESGSKVLDIGCASGYFAKKLKEKNCLTWGVEIDKVLAKKAQKYCQKVTIGDVEKLKSLPFTRNSFDLVLFLDVLEHLKEPSLALNLVKPYLKQRGKMIVSVPNIAFLSVRLSLFFGKFNYRKSGILDANHLRFFTRKNLEDLLVKSGFKMVDLDASSGFSQIIFFGRYLDRLPKLWQYRLTKMLTNLLAYQFIAVAQKI